MVVSINKFKRYSVNLDRSSHDRCKVLANDLTTSVSALLRILIKDAYEKRQGILQKQDASQPCVQA